MWTGPLILDSGGRVVEKVLILDSVLSCTDQTIDKHVLPSSLADGYKSPLQLYRSQLTTRYEQWCQKWDIYKMALIIRVMSASTADPCEEGPKSNHNGGNSWPLCWKVE